MARHLKDVTDEEWAELTEAVLAWLVRHKVAGSIAHEYSLYNALDDEREKSQFRAGRTTPPAPDAVDPHAPNPGTPSTRG